MNFTLYLITVIGFTILIVMCVGLFIHYLRVGLDSRSSRIIDSMPQVATNEIHTKIKSKKR